MRNKGFSLVLIITVPFLFHSCSQTEGIIIVTGNPGSVHSPDSIVNSGGLKIGIVSRRGDFEILTGDFYSAASPALSFDGSKMLFAGKKSAGDTWQIWEIDLGSMKNRQVTASDSHCLYPVYLPDSCIIFSKMTSGDSLKSHFSLFRCNSDGNGAARITFNPATWYGSTILSDGRILAKCSENYPERKKPELMVLRPDGTKAELFCPSEGILTGSRVLETPGGEIFYTSVNGRKTSELYAVRYNNPFDDPEVVSKEGDFISISDGEGDRLMVCFRKSAAEKYMLYEFNPGTGPVKMIHGNSSYDVLDAVMVKEQVKPRNLPSEVDMLVKTGLLLCQDINYPADMRNYLKVASIEVMGIDSSLGIVEPQPDGSIYLKVLADMPFRLTALDKDGKVIRSCKWMSLRPNERRGCTGCHEEPGVVPENRIPMAVRGKDPVIIPAAAKKVNEKTVELE